MTGTERVSLRKQAVADARGVVEDNDYVKLSTQLLRFRWGRVLGGFLVIAAIITAALGGFERVQRASGAAALPPQPPGATIDGGRYTVTVQSAWISHKPQQTLAYYDTSQSQLLVLARVVLNADETEIGTVQDLVWLSGTEGEATEARSTARQERLGGAMLNRLQPGVPTDVLLRWPLPDPAAAAPTRIRIGLKGSRFEPATWATKSPGWVPAQPAGLWLLPVEDRRPAERLKPGARQ